MCSAHALSLAACHTSLVREICDTFFQRRLGIVPPSAIVAPSSVCAECIRHHHKYYSPSTLNTFLISAPYKLFYTVTEYTLLRSLPHAFPHNNTGYLLHAISPKSKEHIACYKHYNKLQIHCCQKHCCETLLQLQNIDKTFHPLIQQYSS